MINLREARAALAIAAPNEAIPVNPRWMAQAVREMEEGRRAKAALADIAEVALDRISAR